MRSKSNQSGNVIMIVLIGIVLFAALSYAVNRSMQGGGDFGGKEKADVGVTELLAFGNSLQSVTKYLLANGCTDTQLSFRSSINGSVYDNASSPTDKSCNVFDQAGGGLTAQKPTPSLLDPNFASSVAAFNWVISGAYCVYGLNGATCSTNGQDSDLVVFLPFLRKDVCLALNARAQISQAGYDTPEEGGGMTVFNGTYTNGVLFGTSASATALRGKTFGCWKNFGTSATQNSYIFYMAFLIR